MQALHLKLGIQHLAQGLFQQQVIGVVAAQHVVDQAAGGLYLAHALALPRIALKHQTGDARDIAELTPYQLGGVEGGQQILQEVAGIQRSAQRGFLQGRHGGRQELEAVVVHGEAESGRGQARQAPNHQCRQPFVDQPDRQTSGCLRGW